MGLDRALTLVPLLLLLGACDDPGGGRGDVRVLRSLDGVPADGRLEVRVLDPAGRRYDHPHGCAVLVRDPATGEVLRGPRPPRVPPDAEVVVLAPGCVPAVVPAHAEGVQWVRLERGIPIRLRLVGREPLPAGLTALGVNLVRPPDADAWWAAGVHELEAVGAAWMDDDLPAELDHVRVPEDADAVALYVPGPGTYRVRWSTGWANHGSSIHTRTEVEVGVDDGGRTFEIEAPTRWLDSEGLQARGEASR